MFLLDTNVVSELRKASRCHPGVADWQAKQKPGVCHISAVTILEIRLGIELARKNDCAKAQILEEWLEGRVKTGFAGRILPVDEAVAEACGRLHAARPRSFRDGLILATAAAHRLTIVTRNTKDFADGGVAVINPWK
ncbi:MAG: type II toxin-antitoxin system VapC family toxin [Chthoniobacterales bacterium]|nr:type II toxin-antitoxin system VapC family toxin [Chthoniobacterales bacterium]